MSLVQFSAGERATWKRSRTARGLLSAEHPQDWQAEDHGAISTLSPPGGEACFAFVTVSRPGGTAEQLLEARTEMEPNMAPCSERFEVVAETWRGIAQHFHGSLGELDTYRALVCFQVDDITVSMVLNTSPETFAANKTLFDEITKSVRVEAFGNGA